MSDPKQLEKEAAQIRLTLVRLVQLLNRHGT